jgi:hypothetical protein
LKYYLPAGNLRASFVDVRDIAAVAVKALTEDRNDKRHNEKYTQLQAQMYDRTTKPAEILSKKK